MYKLNYFNFKERKDNYLVTNDIGNYAFLSKKNFSKLVTKQELPDDIKEELIEKRFIFEANEEIFATNTAIELRRAKAHLFTPTTLHIFVVTKNCNFNCIYCQAGNLNQNEDFNMTKGTAKRAVDIALESPSKHLTFEFQGGEPLLNFDIIKYIVEYSKTVTNDKIIEYNLVSNLTFLTDEMIDFFIENKVTICTSIDGNRELQNINRPYRNHDSYNETKERILKLRKRGMKVNAIQTTTKYSLSRYKEIIDEYIDLGLDSVFIRPLTKLGKADKNWEKIGYTAEEFLDFYKKSLEYIIEKNKEGMFLIEGHSSIFLKKILLNVQLNYMELRSPCGGAIGQLAYYYDGKVYTCDEGRMLSEMGYSSFYIGNVYENTYKDLMQCDCTKAMCVSSCLECLPYCHSCVYMPYCGTCPVINFAQDNNIFAQNPGEYRCKVYSGMLDILFQYVENKEEYDLFMKWIN
ncbi:MAG: His-Xaa-Ser system radical SAM maturase HxsB [Clostridia bacterium]|nr:His-Xaa-Ser system radical SAM maturase HxsB [Clostridia bacterium]